MSRRMRLLAPLAVLISVASLSTCYSPFSEPSEAETPEGTGSGGGNLKFLFVLPKFRGWSYPPPADSRVIDPQTASVHLVVVADEEGTPLIESTVAFSGGTQNDHGSYTTWERAFTVPVAEYPPGSIMLEMLDGLDRPVVFGLNLQRVLVLPGATPVTATISCVPASPAPITGVDAAGAAESGSVAAGHVAYFAFLGAYGARYDITVTRTAGTGEPDLYLFDPKGVPRQKTYAIGGSASIEGYIAASNGPFYVGVFGYGGDVGDFDVTVAFAGAAQGTYPVLNELFFGGSSYGGANVPFSAIELFNPTDAEMDIAGCSIEVNFGYSSEQVTAPPGTVIPAMGYLVLFSEEPDYEDFDLLNANYVSTSSSWIGSPGQQVSVKLIGPPPLYAEADFVLINTSDLTTYPGSWSESGFYASASTVARKTPLADTDSASDWENSHGTLGLPNNVTGSSGVTLEVY